MENVTMSPTNSTHDKQRRALARLPPHLGACALHLVLGHNGVCLNEKRIVFLRNISHEKHTHTHTHTQRGERRSAHSISRPYPRPMGRYVHHPVRGAPWSLTPHTRTHTQVPEKQRLTSGGITYCAASQISTVSGGQSWISKAPGQVKPVPLTWAAETEFERESGQRNDTNTQHTLLVLVPVSRSVFW